MDRSIQDRTVRVDDYLDRQLKDDQFPGMQFVVFNDREILYQYSGGMAKVGDKEKMLPNSLLNVFSTTKVVTAIAILQLVQNRQLSLDDPIEKYITDIPYKGIRILDVLSHSAGIPDPFLGNFFIHWADQHDQFDRDALMRSTMNKHKLKFKPGEKILYSNLGYAILGKVIERVSGLSYENYVTKNVFNKLGLDQREINFGHQGQAHAARPYFKRSSIIYNTMSLLLKGGKTKAEGKWKAMDKPFYFNFPSHGGIMASAREYSKIFADLIKQKPALLSPDMVKTLLTVHSNYKDKHIAASWFKDEIDGVPYFYHQGGGLGYVAEVRLYPERKIGSVLLINRTATSALSILDALDSEFIANTNK